MKNFVVSARKYRPATFEHVVGQAHITTTLKNAIKDKHLAQALLFCGPRGVGKTTCARILAKTINCEQVTAAVEPCNTCAACKSFNNQSSFNVYELDAASNNSVEDIRALVEQVRYPPQAGHYKVYIIDEVHMLSNAAFNAFLKTLEEPPSYAIFILATTEKHKIIPTILSRCQIFDFHRIQPADIVQQLQHIATQENIAYEEEALHLMAQKADGALRDALSIFDLICTFAAGQTVTYQATLQHLHILDHAYYFQLTETFLQSDPAPALLLYDEILKAGFDGYHFLTGLTEHFRNLLVGQDAATVPLLAATDRVREQYKTQAIQAGKDFLYRALSITNTFVLQYKTSNNKRLHVELALIALAHILEAPQQEQKEVQAHPTPEQPPSNREAPQAASKPVSPSPKQPPSNREAPQVASKPVSPSPEQLPSNRETPQAASKPVSPSPEQLSSNRETPQAASKPVSPSPEQLSSNRETPQAASKLPKKPATLQTTIKVPQIDALKQTLSQAPVPSVPATTPQEAPTPLTQEAIQQCCQAYARTLQQAGKLSEYHLLNQDIILEGATLVFQLINAVQQDTLAGIQEELLAYLKTHLKHPNITLRGVVVAVPRDKKPYTAQEKFTYLAQKYPALRTLQEQLALIVQD